MCTWWLCRWDMTFGVFKDNMTRFVVTTKCVVLHAFDHRHDPVMIIQPMNFKRWQTYQWIVCSAFPAMPNWYSVEHIIQSLSYKPVSLLHIPNSMFGRFRYAWNPWTNRDHLISRYTWLWNGRYPNGGMCEETPLPFFLMRKRRSIGKFAKMPTGK